MDNLFTKRFWILTGERVLSAAGAALLGLAGADGLGLLNATPQQIGKVVGLAALAMLLKSLGSATVGEKGTPDLNGPQPEPTPEPEIEGDEPDQPVVIPEDESAGVL